ncbi:MAG: cysteine--tRNA ligase, partial [Pyrinomonadaceae bacterium]|nr:cysteine--tRNA ligase [Pyrinomonadaceae bacterium]
TFEGLQSAESTIERLRDFRQRVKESKVQSPKSKVQSQLDIESIASNALRDFETAMDDNLNTSAALAAIHNFVREINTALANDALFVDEKGFVLNAISKFDSVLNIFGSDEIEMLDDEIQSLIDERQAARRDRNFARSDEIRDLLANKGIILEDTKDGVRWKRK